MIKKITDIKNIGLFFTSHNIASKNFEKNNLIYAENGLGKSTLVSILNSLKNNKKEIIDGRKTIHFSDENKPRFKLLLDGNITIEINDTEWVNFNRIDLEIFDSEYIHKNIFTPTEINRDNRINLFEIIIGEEGSLLSRNIEILKSNRTEINTNLGTCEEPLKRFILTKEILLNNFLSDPVIPLETLVANELTIQNKIDSIMNFETINRLPLLQMVIPSDLNFDNLITYFNKTVDIDIADIKEKVLKYISERLDVNGESWIRNGLLYISDHNSCPFCGQNIANNDFVEVYKKYYSEKYTQILFTMEQDALLLKKQLISELSELAKYEKIIFDNNELYEKWSLHVRLENYNSHTKEEFDLTITTYRSILANNYENILEKINSKIANPNSDVVISFDEVKALQSSYLESRTQYFLMINNVNEYLNEYKRTIDISERNFLEIELLKIKTHKNKHEELFISLLKEYRRLEVAKADNNTELQLKEAELSAYNERIFNEYRCSINTILRSFNRKFEIVDFIQSNRGAQKSVSIGINLFGMNVSLDTNSINVPSFSNTLSEGDKNALAFAFFITKLKNCSNLSQKIVVFDDPFSSMDNNRKNRLVGYIKEIIPSLNQLFILTHHKEFAYLLNEKISLLNVLEIKNDTNGSYIENFHIQEELLSDKNRIINELKKYCIEDYCSVSDIKNKLRISLETELRHKLHWHISKRIEKAKNANDNNCTNPITLGNLITCLDSCDMNPFRRDKIEVITKLRNFISESQIDLDHHATNPNTSWDSNNFTRSELITYIQELFTIYDDYI